MAARIGPDIVFTRPGGTAGLVLEWGSHVQDDDPRFGAPLAAVRRATGGAVERMAFVAALVRDPAADGERLAEVLDTDAGGVRRRDDSAPDVPSRRARSRRLHARALPGPAGRDATSRAVWGGVHERPRCVALALSVADQGVAERALGGRRRRRAPSRRRRPRSCSIPSVLPFPVVLTEQLLPGDPRTPTSQED